MSSKGGKNSHNNNGSNNDESWNQLKRSEKVLHLSSGLIMTFNLWLSFLRAQRSWGRGNRKWLLSCSSPLNTRVAPIHTIEIDQLSMRHEKINEQIIKESWKLRIIIAAAVIGSECVESAKPTSINFYFWIQLTYWNEFYFLHLPNVYQLSRGNELNPSQKCWKTSYITALFIALSVSLTLTLISHSIAHVFVSHVVFSSSVFSLSV